MLPHLEPVETVITDPPYGLTANKRGGTGEASLNLASPAGRSRVTTGGGFMGKAWDASVPDAECWRAVLNATKPGGTLMAFGGTRTWHWLAVAIESAGWEIRDTLAWMYGSGFPKSLDISKAIDKRRYDGEQIRKVTGWIAERRACGGITNAEIDAAFGFNGMAGHWTTQGTQAAVPTLEQVPILLAVLNVPDHDVPEEIRRLLWDLNGRKGQPGEAWNERDVLGTETKARSVAGKSALPTLGAAVEYQTWELTAPATEAAKLWNGWGTSLKPAFEPVILAMRPLDGTFAENAAKHAVAGLNIDGGRIGHASDDDLATSLAKNPGRSDTVSSGVYGADRPQQSVNTAGRWPANVLLDEEAARLLDEQSGELPAGVAVRHRSGGNTFGGSVPKPALDDMSYGDSGGASRFFYTAKASRSERGDFNDHPTVKPLDLMGYLCKLTATPTGGTVIDPFMGSGSTLVAANRLGRPAIGIDLDERHCEIAARRFQEDCPLFNQALP